MKLSRPVHMTSTRVGQQGYTFCGVLLRRVDTTTEVHHASCHRCQQGAQS